MATIYSSIVGIELFDSHRGPRHVARIRCVPATSYTATSDVFQLGGGGKLFGTATTLSLEDQIESIRKDGKTANLVDGMGGAAGGGAANAAHYVDTVAVSGDNLTAELAVADSTETDLTVANSTSPMEVWVTYDLS